MNAKSTIRKFLFIGVWLCIGGGMLSLLLAAISTKNKGACAGYKISFRGKTANSFITDADVEAVLLAASNGNIKGEPIASFNLHSLEGKLEHNSWIDEAELYFDNADVLHVTVSEKKPVARVFTTAGESFFIDSAGRIIPLSQQSVPKLTVFTNFPAKKNLKYTDSSLLDEVKVLANYISQQPFWNAQVAQVDITQNRNFEMIPVVGNHLVRLGDVSDIDKKFRRLLVFYREVLSKTSFDRYKIIDVQYKGQVVASRSEGNHKTDSIQLKRNVEKLLKQSIEAETDTVVKQLPPDLANEMQAELITDEETEPVVANEPVVIKKEPVKPVSKTKTEKKTASKVADVKKPVKKQVTAEAEKKPKAVMPKKDRGGAKRRL